MIKRPCYKCTERHEACHSNYKGTGKACPRYAADKAKYARYQHRENLGKIIPTGTRSMVRGKWKANGGR